MIEKLYRYIDPHPSDDPMIDLEPDEYVIHSVTPKGYWIYPVCNPMPLLPYHLQN